MDQPKRINRPGTRESRTAVPHQKVESTKDNQRTNHQEGQDQKHHQAKDEARLRTPDTTKAVKEGTNNATK